MKEANNLVFTSVEDMKSTLGCAESNGEPYSIEILKQAVDIASKLGEKTRVKILQAKIRKYEKDGRNQ